MFVIVEIYDHAVLAYPEGDVQVFVNSELAYSHTIAISANNPGVWQVQPLYTHSTALMDKRTHTARVSRKDPLKITGEYPMGSMVIRSSRF